MENRKIKTETLNKIIKQLENTVSQDPTRHYLGMVQITPKLIVSTDGHMLTTNKIDDESLASVGELYIHWNMLPYLKTVAKLYKRMSEVPSEITETSINVDGKLVSEKDKVKYPNWRQFTPEYTETFEVGLNPELLVSLVETLREGKNPACKLIFKKIVEKDKQGNILDVRLDNCSPINVTTSSGDRGVLMPCRV